MSPPPMIGSEAALKAASSNAAMDGEADRADDDRVALAEGALIRDHTSRSRSGSRGLEGRPWAGSRAAGTRRGRS